MNYICCTRFRIVGSAICVYAAYVVSALDVTINRRCARRYLFNEGVFQWNRAYRGIIRVVVAITYVSMFSCRFINVRLAIAVRIGRGAFGSPAAILYLRDCFGHLSNSSYRETICSFIVIVVVSNAYVYMVRVNSDSNDNYQYSVSCFAALQRDENAVFGFDFCGFGNSIYYSKCNRFDAFSHCAIRRSKACPVAYVKDYCGTWCYAILGFVAKYGNRSIFLSLREAASDELFWDCNRDASICRDE